MALKYTEEKLNSLDKETIIHLFLSQQEQLGNIDGTLQLVLEQVADLKRQRFGRSSERHETEDRISFMEVNGKIVFFNESEAVAVEESSKEETAVPRRKPKKTGEVGRRSGGPASCCDWAFPYAGGTGSQVRVRGL